MMPLQRACDAGTRQETSCQMDRGGRSQMCFSQSILRRYRQAYKCRGYVSILPSARFIP